MDMIEKNNYEEYFLKQSFFLGVRKIISYLNIQKNREDNTLNLRSMNENIKDAMHFLDNPNLNNLEEMIDLILDNSQNLHNPRYIGHQVSAPIPISGLFELLSSILNQGMTIYEMGPFSSSVENLMISKICQKIGYTSESGGILTSGGSLGNLTAILAARGKASTKTWNQGVQGKSIILVNENSHYSITRAAGIIGIGTDNCIPVATENSKILMHDLEEKIISYQNKGFSILAVIASSCTTKDGTFDDLNGISKICEKYNVWLHVDAAHGGGVIFSKKYNHLISGLEKADSILIDGHKMLSLPALTSYVLYRNAKDQYYSVNQIEDYLFLEKEFQDKENPDTGLATIECTKRAAALSFWGVWSLYGESFFEKHINKTFDMAQEFKMYMQFSSCFEVLNSVESNIILFRFDPSENKEYKNIQSKLRESLIKNGKFYIVESKFENMPCLRMTIMNDSTSLLDLIDLEEELYNIYWEIVNNEKHIAALFS